MKQIQINQMNQKDIEKYLSTTISLIGVYSTLTHHYETEALILFIIYYLNDIKKKTITKDFIIHHILAISLTCISLHIKYNNLPNNQIRKMFFNMELTTPIFILNNYIDNNFTKILFFISFSYCRVYMQYHLLNEEQTYHEFSTMRMPYIIYTLLFGLFGLNLYWYTIMVKKISKPFKDLKYIECHKYIPFIPNSLNPLLKFNILDFYSIISNYLYHNDIYNAKINNIYTDTYKSSQTIAHSVVNSMVSISSIEPCYYKYSIPIHLCKIFNLDEIIPIGVDTCFYFSSDAILIYYIFVLVRSIKPFYNMNPLAIHLLLILLKSYSRVTNFNSI